MENYPLSHFKWNEVQWSSQVKWKSCRAVFFFSSLNCRELIVRARDFYSIYWYWYLIFVYVKFRLKSNQKKEKRFFFLSNIIKQPLGYRVTDLVPWMRKHFVYNILHILDLIAQWIALRPRYKCLSFYQNDYQEKKMWQKIDLYEC